MYTRDATGYYSEPRELCPPSSLVFLKVRLNSNVPEGLNRVRITFTCVAYSLFRCLVRRLSGAFGVRFKGKNKFVGRPSPLSRYLIDPTDAEVGYDNV